MDKVFTRLCAVVLAIVCVCLLQGCAVIGNPFKSADAMRQDLLKFTPVGSNLSEVEQKLRKKRFEVERSNHGFSGYETKHKPVGQKSIKTPLVGYRSGLFSSTVVMAAWAFDDADKLIDVWVWKDVDSL